LAIAFDRHRTAGLLTIAEAAAFAGVHRSTIRAWCGSGRLPFVRVSARGDRRLRQDDLERVMAERALVAAKARAETVPAITPSQAVGRRSRGRVGNRRLSVVRDQISRGDALRRIASEISGKLDLDTLFNDVLDHSAQLFGSPVVALWLYDPHGPRPLHLAAHRGVSDPILQWVASLERDSPAPGLAAIRTRRVRVVADTERDGATPAHEVYREDGIRTVCFVPVIFRDEPLGLLVIYHRVPFAWSRDEIELARAFADQMATAIQNARLHQSVQGLAARLKAIQDLALRLDRIQDVAGIGAAIVAEARSLIDYHTIRVYRVDHETGFCEPIAFQGSFMGVENPDPAMLRVRIGQGLTGWVAANDRPLIVADAAEDPRSLVVGPTTGPESMLLVPMTYEGRVQGVIVVSQLGRDKFGSDEEITLSIFNADSASRMRRQQAELEFQLTSQRRLLEVNERLLSTLDPHGVLELIADSLKAVVAYDTLTIYRVDHEAGLRRPVVARDRFADVIMEYAAPLGIGITGWAIDHGEAVCANEAHLDPRSVQIPGTPFEPESMMVVPLQVNGEVIGTLNVGRMGEAESHFNQNEFELTKLFAGQASIALQNAETHRAVEVRAELDALTGLRNHGAFQRELGEAVAHSDGTPFSVLMLDLDAFKAFNDARGHPAGDRLLREIGGAITAATRDGDRVYRYGGDEFSVILPRAVRSHALEVAERIRRAVEVMSPAGGPAVGVSVGASCFPEDGRTKDELVAAADAALYLAKPSGRGDGTVAGEAGGSYLQALNDTALALMDRLDPTELLEAIIHRATALMGTSDGFIYVVEPDESAIVVRVGIGLFGAFIGYRMQRGEGVSGTVWETGEPMTVDDYDAFSGRSVGLPTDHRFGAIAAVPLTAAGAVVGVLGLASGALDRRFGERELTVLGRFAQLASIALANARLFEAAQREVTERAHAEEALRISEERFRRLSDATTESLAVHRDGILLEVNQALCHLMGYSAEELIGRNVLDLTAPESREAILRHIRLRPDEPIEALALDAAGAIFPVELRGRTIPYTDGQPARVASVRDLREHRALEERLAHQSLYDTVTGLPNRVLLMDRVKHSLSWTRPGEGAPVAVILLDLDRFKVINESLGHAAGDELLAAVGRRLQDCLRPGDTVARFGGDEFGVLLDGIDRPDEARQFAEQIEALFHEPFGVGGRDVFVTGSMGIVVGQPGVSEPDDLLRNAEIALYRAKADATVRHAMFEPSMSAATVERLDMENDLRRAIERGELRLHYQPLVDLATDRIVGLEALVRWQHPSRGLMPPLSFIPLAEETGLILPLGRWVLETACRQAREWQQAFPSDPPMTMSVNLSARQFAQPNLVTEVAAILAETGLPPATLELEITESVVMDESEAGIRTLRELRGLGCRLALDDFGTGYSSLSYLKHLPLDTIKIDRSFVAGLAGDDANLPIVQAVISLAHGLGIDVTAEGIETAEQLGWLRDLVCDRGQGYYYARPLPADELVRLLGPDAPPIGQIAPVVHGRTRVAMTSRGNRARHVRAAG
jgi:diguanylate cyclase (GGDEF)-like protein/PAS domain S-box-containing protein/excisionase family DNA binding protein